MMRHGVILAFAAVAIFVAGCRTPMKRHLARYWHWEQAAQHMAAEKNAAPVGLVWKAFPLQNDPVHVEIWKALWEEGRIGDGWGAICSYYGFYLVTVSDPFNHHRLSSFYDATNHWVLRGSEDFAFDLYGGERTAAVASIRQLVQHLLAVSGYEAFLVDNCYEIPHTAFRQDNPNLSFADFLAAKGLGIGPPMILKKNEQGEYSPYSECSVFAYMPCGGQVFRYEIRCEGGRVSRVERFLVATDVGDCWYIR